MVQKVNFNNLTGDTLTIGNTVITGTGVTVDGSALGGGGVSATTLTKTFANSEVYTMTLDNAIEGAPIVGATRLGGGVGTVGKDNWDVNSTASNYDFWNEAPNTDILYVYANSCPWQPHGMIPDDAPTVGDSITALSPTESGITAFEFGDEGRYFYLNGTTLDDVNYWKLPTPYDITSNTSTGGTFSPQDTNLVHGFHLSANGSQLVTIDSTSDDIYFYSLSTPWDLSSSTGTAVVDPAVPLAAADQVFMSPDGTYLYLKDGAVLYKWTLTTPWDGTTAGVASNITSSLVSIQTVDQTDSVNFTDLRFNNDGTEVFMTNVPTGGYGQGVIVSYALSTPGDLETIIPESHVASDFKLGTATTGVSSFFTFSHDGKKIFLADLNTDKVYTYSTGPGVQKASGNWSKDDRYKRVIANSGEVTILTPSGYYDTITAMASTSNVSAGNWSLFAGKANATKGITPNNYEHRFMPLTNYWARNTLKDSPTVTTLADFKFGNNGYLLAGVKNDGSLYYYNLTSAWDPSTMLTDWNTFDLTLSSTVTVYAASLDFKPDGTRLYIYDSLNTSGTIHEYSMSTAWDVSTLSYVGAELTGVETTTGDTAITKMVIPSDSGSYIFFQDGNGEQYYRLDMSTAWDISTATITAGQGVTIDGQLDHKNFSISPNGTLLAYYNDNHKQVNVHPFGTAYDLTSIPSVDNGGRTTSDRGDVRFYIADPNNPASSSYFRFDSNNQIYEYWIHYPGKLAYFTTHRDVFTDQWVIAITNSAGQIDSSTWIDLNTFTPDEVVPQSSQVYYAMSRDNKQSFEIVTDSGGVRTIALLDTVWKYNQANVHSANSFAVATSNSAYGALKDALDWSATNRWSNSQISIVTDQNNFPAANSTFFASTFDLAIMMKHGTLSTQTPTSDAISINYDSAIRERGAILGTHYTWVKESNTQIEITVADDAGSNYKFRVI